MNSLTCSISRHADSGVGVESHGGSPVAGFDPVALAELLAAFDPSGLGDGALLAVLSGLERVVAAAHAAQAKAMAEFVRLRPATQRRNASQVRDLVRRAVLRVDPDGARRRRERARADRKVILTPLDDGMAELAAVLPAEQATAVYRRVDTLARAPRSPARSP